MLSETLSNFAVICFLAIGERIEESGAKETRSFNCGATVGVGVAEGVGLGVAEGVGLGDGVGVAEGDTAALAGEAADVPPLLIALAVNVYEVPLTRFVTTQEPEAPVIVQLLADGDEVTMKEVAVPVESAATVTFTSLLPATTVGADGATGTPEGFTATLCGDEAELPVALVATTAKVYEVPLTRLFTTQEFSDAAIVQEKFPGVDRTV